MRDTNDWYRVQKYGTGEIDLAAWAAQVRTINLATENAPKASTRIMGERAPAGMNNYEGVVRQRRKVIWACGHVHRNRDTTTIVSGMSALECAERHLRTLDA
jgi:hypothetical protein